MTDTPGSLFVSQVFQRAFAEHCRRQKRPKNFTVKVHKIAASRKLPLIFAGMMELVDMRDLGSRASGVGVRVPMPAPNKHDGFDTKVSETIVLFFLPKRLSHKAF